MKLTRSSCKFLYLTHGFTLPEVLVIVITIGIFSSLAIASFMSSVQSQSLSSASIQLSEWLENTRKRAMQQNKPCRIEVISALSRLRASASNECGPFEEFSITATSSENIKICYRNINPLAEALGCSASTPNSNSTVTFSPRGSVTSDYVFEFYITPGQSKTCTIILKPLGIIQQGRITNGYCQTPT